MRQHMTWKKVAYLWRNLKTQRFTSFSGHSVRQYCQTVLYNCRSNMCTPPFPLVSPNAPMRDLPPPSRMGKPKTVNGGRGDGELERESVKEVAAIGGGLSGWCGRSQPVVVGSCQDPPLAWGSPAGRCQGLAVDWSRQCGAAPWPAWICVPSWLH